MGDIKELLQNLDAFCFNYQQMDCLYTLFQYHLSSKSVIKTGQSFDIPEISLFQPPKQSNGQNAQHCEKETFEEKNKQYLLSSFQSTKLTQISGSVLLNRNEQVKKKKFQIEQTKSVDCFQERHGNFAKNLVSLKRKSLQNKPFFEFPADLNKSIDSANNIVITPIIKNPVAIKNGISKKTECETHTRHFFIKKNFWPKSL